MKITIMIDEKIPVGKQIANKLWDSKFTDEFSYWLLCQYPATHWTEEQQRFIGNAFQYESRGMLIDYDKRTRLKHRKK